jgi:hypothetical protein
VNGLVSPCWEWKGEQELTTEVRTWLTVFHDRRHQLWTQSEKADLHTSKTVDSCENW